ncbi:hypothetical protein [Clavibacter zhangzhiyongii]|uniref:hypothetical protein n=1 Tax=Clavibacter zhangzhiyongii TaxID=2768071 RepID=UPI0039E1A49A
MTSADHEEPGRDRLLRFRDLLRGGAVPDVGEHRPRGRRAPRRHRAADLPGLADRLGYGAATIRTATWAGAHGFRLLASAVTERGARATDFGADQRALVDAYRAAHPNPSAAHVTLTLVVVPTDGATAEQVARYRADAAARAERAARAARADGPRGASSMVRAADLVGPSDELAAALRADPAVQAADELAVVLPGGLRRGRRRAGPHRRRPPPRPGARLVARRLMAAHRAARTTTPLPRDAGGASS